MTPKLSVQIGTNFLGSGHPLLQLTGVGQIVSAVASNMIMVAGIVLVFIIIYAGTSMVTGAGEPQKFERAKLILTSAIIGFVIVAAAWLIVTVVETSTGANILS